MTSMPRIFEFRHRPRKPLNGNPSAPTPDEDPLAQQKAREIIDRLTKSLPQDFNPQSQSPLFGKLPPEIRNIIFELATAQHDDKTKPYAEDAYYYRPGYQFAQKTCTSLLSTCRLIYWETHSLPRRNTTETKWYERGPDEGKQRAASRNPQGLFPSAGRTEKNRQDLHHVHFFIQLYMLEDGQILSRLRTMGEKPFLPKLITITIRHTDWWYWENGQPLRIKDHWTETFVPSKELKELRVEFETLDVEHKRQELESILHGQVPKWKFALDNGVKLEIVGREEKRWAGKANFEGNKFERAHGKAEEIKYYIVVITWRPEKEKLGARDE